ncbi:hypothetical protein AAY80_077 [Stenotrophomonas phage vB_SmaS-DLP_6]|nr:hypothetical protein AAY80_077 [Stenotrophomonas phage vB_SmaS-DLP_6]
MVLNDSNFLLYAAKHYDNPSCSDMEEFHDDLNRFKYIKRLFTKYKANGELKERLVLNHIIVLYNLFGDAATNMLFFKLEGQWQYLKPFLIAINRMPEHVTDVGKHKHVRNSDIPMDMKIVEILRGI